MIYIRFPHPDLANHVDLARFLAKVQHSDGDWTSLFDWLEAHQYVGTNGLGGGKCWYSEQPIGGKGDREVEHFRPKMKLSSLTTTHRNDLRKKGILAAIEPFLEESGEGYPWLRFKASNYRLSSASVNMQGSKGSIFPVLKGAQRIEDPSEDYLAEFAILLDPSVIEDVESLAINPIGEITPAFAERPNPAADFVTQWNSNGMRWLRAEVSIVVFDLNNSSWIKSRKDIYDKVTRDTLDLRSAIASGNEALLRKCKELLLERTRKDAPFAGAGRSALQDQIRALAASNALPDKLAQTVLKEIQATIRRAEYP